MTLLVLTLNVIVIYVIRFLCGNLIISIIFVVVVDVVVGVSIVVILIDRNSRRNYQVVVFTIAVNIRYRC